VLLAVLASLAAAAAAATDPADPIATLDFGTALELAQQNHAVVLARGQLEQAQGDHEAAFQLLSAELRSGYVQTFSGNGDGPRSHGRLEPVTLSARLNVLPFDPVADERARAAWRLAEAELAVRDAQHQAVLDTARHYLAAVRAEQAQALGEAALLLAQQKLDATRARLAGGAASHAQVLDAELALSQAQNELASLIRQQPQALARLSATIGRSVNSLDTALDTASAPERTLCPAETLPPPGASPGLRLDVLRAEHAVLQAELAVPAAVRQAGADASLSFSATAAGERQSLGVSALIDSRSVQPGVSLSFDPGFGTDVGSPGRSRDASGASMAVRVSVPLDGRAGAARAAAERNLEQARLQLQLAGQHAELDQTGRALELEAAGAAAQLNQQVLEARLASLQTAEQRLELGVISELDLLQARQDLQTAELALARSKDAVLLAALQHRQAQALDPRDCLPQSSGTAGQAGFRQTGNSHSLEVADETH
jgi:outer membrane protein